jgi:hypothetical protein
MNMKLRVTILGLCLSGLVLAWHTSSPGEAAEARNPVPPETAKILERAQQGNVESQNMAGLAYKSGNGVAQDDAKAAQWFKRAAAKGYPPAEFNLAKMYWEGRGVRRDTSEAVHWLNKAAAKGHAPAESALGSLYHSGGVVKQDLGKAVAWYTKAAEHGDADGQYNLGLMYETGQGVRADCAQAFKWLTQAAAQNLPAAQFRLGRIYDTGSCAPRNDKEAARLFQAAAAQGNHEAEARLGWFYLMGYGVEQNDTLAAQCFTRAAQAGDATGQFMLGQLYRDGRAVNKDTVAAYKWFKLAVAAGSKIDGSESLKPHMSPQEIATAEAQVRAWKTNAAGTNNGSTAAQEQDSKLQTASLHSGSSVFPPGFDQYGGLLAHSCKKTGRFHTEKQGQRWWLCTPAGHVYWNLSVGGMIPGESGCDPATGQCYNLAGAITAKYGDTNAAWGPAQVRRVQSWGFNGIGQDSYAFVTPVATDGHWPKDHSQPNKMPMVNTLLISNYAQVNLSGYASGAVKDLVWGINSRYNGWRASSLDFFDGNFAQWLQGFLAKDGAAQSYKNSPWVIGLFFDDTDYFWGMGAGPDINTGHVTYHLGYITLITSPSQTFNHNGRNYRNEPAMYPDSKVSSKVAMASPSATCSIATPCSLRDYLAKKYRTIGALNQAWGSNYTTFDSSGTPVVGESLGAGDGSTKVFTKNLDRSPVSPESVAIKLGGNLQGGDCPWWWRGECHVGTSGMGTLGGASGTKIASGTINYSKGQITVTFSTAPEPGQAVTVDYVANGWMYGTGLMDEDGRNTAWVGTNPVCLSPAAACNGKSNPIANANPHLAADLDEWLGQFAAQYFRTCRHAMSVYDPHMLYLGTDTVGTWGTPARKEILQAAAQYVDGLAVQWMPDQPDLATGAAVHSFLTRYFGDKPLFNLLTMHATADSALYRYTNTSGVLGQFVADRTQGARGQRWHNYVNAMLTTPGYNGTYQWVGAIWWGLYDFWNEKTNWGLVSLSDNAYDGKEAATGTHACSPPLDAYNCGKEDRNYGDTITQVKQANMQWTQY